AGRGGLGAIRAGTSMGSAASTAYRLGQETSGHSTVRAGVAGIASAASGAASQGIKSAAARVTDPLRASAESGRQAVLNARRMSSGAGPSAVPASDAVMSGAAPPWAQNLRSEQNARHRRQMAMQTIRDGDRPGSAANPDLSDKE